ncbi:MAG: D-alanine--D-alanine ligase [Alphaproteobacteria bacterium]|nr:D-alanine--D-alanine ligase [Alphaproteobacteria bacterium]
MAGFIPVVHGAALDRPDEIDTLETAAIVAATLEALGYRSETLRVGLDLSPLGALAARQPYAVFNLVEALEGSSALAHLPVAVMEELRLAVTGVSARAMAVVQDKLATKARLLECGLPAAPAFTGGEPVPSGLPVIVKSVREHASLGLDAGSVVPGAEAAALIAERSATYGTPFFAEAYLEGREFNLSVLETAEGPAVLPIAEMCFIDFPDAAPRIVDYAAKWDSASAVYHGTQRAFGLEEREPALAERLRALSLAAWEAFSLNGFARVDFRLDAGGNPFILEVNANPGLAPDAGFAAAAGKAGLSYGDLIAALIDAARR